MQRVGRSNHEVTLSVTRILGNRFELGSIIQGRYGRCRELVIELGLDGTLGSIAPSGQRLRVRWIGLISGIQGTVLRLRPGVCPIPLAARNRL